MANRTKERLRLNGDPIADLIKGTAAELHLIEQFLKFKCADDETRAYCCENGFDVDQIVILSIRNLEDGRSKFELKLNPDLDSDSFLKSTFDDVRGLSLDQLNQRKLNLQQKFEKSMNRTNFNDADLDRTSLNEENPAHPVSPESV